MSGDTAYAIDSSRTSLALIMCSLVLVGAGCDSGDDAPAAGSPPTKTLADGGDGRVTVAAAGDIGMERAGVATLEGMGASDADAYLGLGDLSYAGPGSEDEFCELVSSRVGADAPFEIIAGNHEEDAGEDGRIERFAACLPDRVGAVGEYPTQYYFDVGRLARFIMISPDLTIDGAHYYYGPDDEGGDTANLVWLKDAIDEARDAGRWVVVGMHNNCISVGEYYCNVYQDLFSALIERRVDLVLSGNDHTYQRSRQLAAPRPGCAEVVVDEFDPDCIVGTGDTYRGGAGSAFLIAATGGGELYRGVHGRIVHG